MHMPNIICSMLMNGSQNFSPSQEIVWNLRCITHLSVLTFPVLLYEMEADFPHYLDKELR